MLNLVALVDNRIPLILLDHALELRALVTWHDGKAIPLAMNALVLRERHKNASLAAAGFPAFTPELESLVCLGPIGALVESSDLLVHRPHEILVSSLALEPFLHTQDPMLRQTKRVLARRVNLLGRLDAGM